jgi:hypothetical protein
VSSRTTVVSPVPDIPGGEDAIQELLATEDVEVLFVAGCEEN